MNPPALSHRFQRSIRRSFVAAVLMFSSNPVPAAATEELDEKLATIARAARGLVGVVVELLETGESASLHGDAPFPMQSVYKFPIAMAVLAQVDAGRLRLDDRVHVEPADYLSPRQHSPIRDRNPAGIVLTVDELLQFMVQESDGSACDVLLRLIGGPNAAHDFLRGLGINDVVVATTEREMGVDESVQYRNAATPTGMAALLRRFHQGSGLSAESRARLVRWMTETTTGRRRLKGDLPTGTVVIHKTGSSRTVDGKTAATNDVGLIVLPDGRHLAIAVFVRDSLANDATREGVIAAVARAAWDHWAPR